MISRFKAFFAVLIAIVSIDIHAAALINFEILSYAATDKTPAAANASWYSCYFLDGSLVAQVMGLSGSANMNDSAIVDNFEKWLTKDYSNNSSTIKSAAKVKGTCKKYFSPDHTYTYDTVDPSVEDIFAPVLAVYFFNNGNEEVYGVALTECSYNYQSGNAKKDTGWKDVPKDPIEYLTWDEGAKSLVATNTTSYTVVTKDTATFGNGWYVVNDTVERDSSITVTGSAHLILCDGASLTVTGWDSKAGISVASGNSLAIYGQTEGTGALEAWGDTFCAGIGGSEDGSCGTITINGGKITATGEMYAAGIGGGKACSSAATITINGGEIEAIGGLSSAGIGSGNYNGFSVSRSDTDLITINGGTIKATGGQYGAGIGSGDSGFAATVVINGGEITASTKNADAIGKGFEATRAATVTFCEGAEVSIKAGATEDSATETAVDAFVANHTAKYAEIVVTPPDTIEYLKWDESTKALVAANTRNYTVVTKDTATFEDKKWYVVKGTIERAGIRVKGAAHLILCDGASLKVTGAEREAGINVASGKSLTIYGQASGTGALIANGGSHEAGIGGSDMSACGNITINGGTVTANGISGAGIGGGAEGAGGTVTINAGTITASSSYGAGIGAGQSSSAHGVITFAEGVEFSIVAGDDESSATENTLTEYMVGRSAKYVKIDSAAKPKVTLDEIIDGEDWTKFDVAYTLENLEEGVDYKVLIDVTAGGVTKTITNATDIVIGSFTNSVDTVQLFGSKVFDGEAKVVLSLEADGEVISSATEKTVSILPPPVEYLTWDEETKSLVAATNQAYEVVTADTATFEDGKWYVVKDTITRGPITVNGAAHLILCDGASLTVTGGENKAGITVANGCALTIYGQSEGTGKLDATGGDDGAGIGGNYKGTCGTITINGGKITATSSYSGAGIGGGYWCNNPATITINGGTVKATGGEGGAGIGSGDYHAYGGSRTGSDIITINGGEIEANGGKYAAGIGCGSDGRAVMVTINGGKVTAIGGREGAGIGAGDASYTATIEVNGGKIKAIGGDYGAGIGGGDGVVVPVTITVNDGEIEAIGGQQGAGIGAGNYYQFVGSRSGTDVITINGGTIQATGGRYGAGIGNGAFGLDATVAINGGAITASTTQAEAIGSGYNAVSATTVAFGAEAELMIKAGADEASATTKTTTEFVADHSATYAKISEFGDIYSITPLSESGKVYEAGETVKFQVRLVARNYNTPNPTAYQLVYTGSGTEAEDKVSNPPMLGIVVSGQLRGAKIVEVKPATISGDQTVNPYTDLICEYVVQSGDLAVPITLALNGSTENNPIVPGSAEALGGSGYFLLNGDKWDIRPVNASKSVKRWFASSTTANDAKGFWSQLGEAVVDYKLTQANFRVFKLDSVNYLNWEAGQKKLVPATCPLYDVVRANTKTFEDGVWYVVTNTVECGAITVSGEAHLILCDGASLTVTGAEKVAGVEVPEGSALTIYGQSEGTGKFEANGGKQGAGIGGNAKGTCGTITINGGKVKSTGGDYGAGIGGGEWNRSPMTITINAGEIEAIGGAQGAGIGSGNYYKFNGSQSGTDTITINGGTITATGGQWGAGIGSGSDGLAMTITINGGTITASTSKAEAIGNGGDAVAATTVAFGTALASRYVWAGASATTGEMITTAAFASDHSATYAEVPIETYTVAYDGNGAAGVMSNDVFAVSREATLKKNAFTTPLGYTYAGWATNSVGGVVYNDEATGTDFATTNATLSLYAKWELDSNGVTATDFTSLTNLIAQAATQGANLPITIDFTSDVKIDGAALPTLPTGTGFNGLKYVGDEEGGSNLYIEDGVLYGSAMRGEVTVDALQLMQLEMGGSISSFQAITEGETTVTNAVVMLLGDNGKAYFNDTDDVDQMIADILAADPRPTTVKLYEVKGAMVTFEAMGGILENGTESTTYLCLPDTGYVLPDKVERDGYKLKGWYTSWKSGANEITNNQVIVNYAPQSLYAQWTSTAPTQSSKGELHLPDIVNGTPTTTIADANYRNNTTLKNVITPVHLESIGQYAFSGCTALNKLMITSARKYSDLTPITVQVGKNAFSGCSSLEELNVGGKVAFGQSAFQNCAKLKKLVFRGDEAITYGSSAFYRCGYNNGTGELKVYMSDEFKTANTALVNDLKKWNTTLQIIPMTLTLPVKGIENINIDFSKLSTTRKLAVLVQTTVQGVPEADNVDIEYSATLGGAWKALKGEKTAYPDGTVLIEVTAPTGTSGFFRAVVK